MNIYYSRNLLRFHWATIFVFLLMSLNACGGVSGNGNMADSQSLEPTTTYGNWTWISGDSKANQRGVYGTLGVGAAEYNPGARTGAVSWIDREDNLWLFGGYGRANKRVSQYLNDLWKFDGVNWIWVSGDNTGSEHGIYGTKGIAAGGNKPGGRSGAISWIDSQGNLWLFGGQGYSDKGFLGYLNDLWKFDGRSWTWVSGDKKIDQIGFYDMQGDTERTNYPGGRCQATGWIDIAGNLWLFGGFGYDKYGGEGYLNDLWKFDGTTWSWVSGDSMRNETGDYGTQGIASDTNKPGARSNPIHWIDAEGSLWLFGGHGVADISLEPGINSLDIRPLGAGFLNDFWKFDGSVWTWIAGSNKTSHGQRITSERSSNPCECFGGVGWYDATGNLWLFGGAPPIPPTNMGNDLWKFDGSNWIRIYRTASQKDRNGVYGTKGVAAETNRPMGRFGAVGWTDRKGNLWLFGGRKSPSSTGGDYFNDLWKFEPQSE